MMQNAVQRTIRGAVVALVISAVTATGAALAQSGSAGGSIGNDEKSLSGSREAPRSVEPSRPARRGKSEADAPRGVSRNSGGGGGGGNYDGAWAILIAGCGGTANTAVIITSGRIVGQNLSGRVGSNGSSTSVATDSNGLTWNSSGRFSSRTGSGSFRRSDGCTGSWTASKQ
jgi:hypothetical protein